MLSVRRSDLIRRSQMALWPDLEDLGSGHIEEPFPKRESAYRPPFFSNRFATADQLTTFHHAVT